MTEIISFFLNGIFAFLEEFLALCDRRIFHRLRPIHERLRVFENTCQILEAVLHQPRDAKQARDPDNAPDEHFLDETSGLPLYCFFTIVDGGIDVMRKPSRYFLDGADRVEDGTDNHFSRFVREVRSECCDSGKFECIDWIFFCVVYGSAGHVDRLVNHAIVELALQCHSL